MGGCTAPRVCAGPHGRSASPAPRRGGRGSRASPQRVLVRPFAAVRAENPGAHVQSRSCARARQKSRGSGKARHAGRPRPARRAPLSRHASQINDTFLPRPTGAPPACVPGPNAGARCARNHGARQTPLNAPPPHMPRNDKPSTACIIA